MVDKIKGRDGVTLIELLVVLTIIGILSAIVSFSASWFMRESRLIDNRDRLLADLEFMKLNAITKPPHAVFLYSPIGSLHYYELLELNDADGNFVRDAGELTTKLTASEAKGYNCDPDSSGGGNDAFCFRIDYKLTWTNCAGAPSNTELWFDRKGIPRCSDWSNGSGIITIWMDDNNNNGIDAGELTKTITIDSSGRIQYEQ